MSNYSAPSQITERQQAYFKDKHVLIAGELEDNYPVALSSVCKSVAVFTTHYGYYLQSEKYKEVNTYYGAELDDNIKADIVLLYWPKAKQEAGYLLAMLMSKLGTGTEIVVVGENRSGVKSIEKMFEPYGRIHKYDSARRCSFYWGECCQTPQIFDLQKWFKTYQINVGNQPVTIKSLPGVFSHGRLDDGSKLLLETLKEPRGKVLDFGCGAGVIGVVAASQNSGIRLSMCDVSALAIESAKATLAANGLDGEVFPSDVYSDIHEKYDYIISNPPFHSGLETNYHAAESLLSRAPEYLNQHGQLVIVANSFLKYSPLIEQAFGQCQTLAKNSRFAIYQAQQK
ncbi:16S rRNA (guanine(1207)-N(2))-methyltransferase RsmC [Vibrio aerogenes]|nr:16S rRNA (guanine(1207)-N(2))-methyltransferase RsmC [Vibrio aerogenes]